jgi:hypothetical protein
MNLYLTIWSLLMPPQFVTTKKKIPSGIEEYGCVGKMEKKAV